MIQEHIINSRHVLEMVSTIKKTYEGGFSNPSFNQDLGVPCKTEEEYISYLENLKDKESIVRDILEYVVGFGIFKAKGFRDGDKVLYVNGSFEVNVTEEYLEAYFRYFEDVEN
jgi:hypothetical protein